MLRKGLIFILILGLTAGIFAQDGEGEATPENPQFNLPLTRDVTYAAQRGDTLDQIAAAFDVRLGCLRETNNLRPADILAIGQELLISVDCPAYDGTLTVTAPRANAPGRTGEDGTYVVRPNDTIETIAQALNVSSVSLLVANDIRYGRDLKAGDVLTIPDDAPEYGVYPALEDDTLEERLDAAGDDAETYIVQPNDTLDTIGQKLNISSVELLQWNGLRNGRELRAGFTLVIPADAAPYGEFPALKSEANTATRTRMERGDLKGEEYVIQPNDTLDTIAQKFNVSVVSIRLENEIDSIRDVTPGRLIIIPADAPAYGVFPAIDQPAGTRVAGGRVYVIQPGDTLDHIAALFNVDTLCLVDQNGVENVRLIQPGQSLGIPADCPAYSGFDFVPDTPPATDD